MCMKKIGYLCCIACLCFACKTAEKAAKEPKAKKEKTQIITKQAEVSDKYGSPNVKQKLVNQDMFLITEFSADSTYGYTADNPIMVGGGGKDGVQNEKRYLNALAGPLGLPVIYKRLNSCCMFYTKNGNDLGDGKPRGLLDVYEVIHDSMEEPVILYINMYDSDVLKVPVGGFTLKN